MSLNDESTSCTMASPSGGRQAWRAALLYAAPVCLLVLILFYYWFAVADRYFVFLYYHDMGPFVPDTSPFSPVTISRYWMTGLVASGAILVLYAAANWLLGRLGLDRPPAWWRVWPLSVLPLLIGIPVITMTVNAPTLPLVNATQATLALLAGLILALLPGEMAARRPGELFWLGLDGMGLMLFLVTAVGAQNVPRWLASGEIGWIWMTIVTLAVAVAWPLVVTSLLALFRRPVPGAAPLFLAGLSVAYLLMPLLHHVLGTDGLFYITNSNNFFAGTVALQIAIWLLAGGLVWVLTRLRHSFTMWRTVGPVRTTRTGGRGGG
jgi:hypothetical protein